jgi:hypothetical protein
MTRISTACSWVNIGSLCKAAILAQVGHFYSGGVGQYYSGANSFQLMDQALDRLSGQYLSPLPFAQCVSASRAVENKHL